MPPPAPVSPVADHGIGIVQETFAKRPRHKRTATGFGSREIKAVEASIPDPLREK